MNINNYYKVLGYDSFDVAIPLTFHIKAGNDPEYSKFESMFNKY